MAREIGGEALGVFARCTEQNARDATNALLEGLDHQIVILSQALVELFDAVMLDPNLTVRMKRAAMKAAGGAMRVAEDVVEAGSYIKRGQNY